MIFYLLDSPGFLRVLVVLAAVMGPLLPGFLCGAVVVLDFAGYFRSFVADAVPWRGWGGGVGTGHFCGRVYRNQNFTVTWCADLEKLWESLAVRGASGPLWGEGVAVAWVL